MISISPLSAKILALVCFGTYAACLCAKFFVARRMGGFQGFRRPWQLSAEMRQVRKSLGNDPVGRRMDLLDKIGAFGWLGLAAVFLLSQLHSLN
jgi:hypothetical protein